jgi:D-apiose dehydrogenase
MLCGVLIGAGWVSQFHLEGWRQIAEAKIAAIVDPDLERARVRAQEFGINPDRVFSSLGKCLDAGIEPNFVDLAVNPEVHLEMVQTASSFGLDIISQKPLAVTLEDAQTMIDICEQAGVKLLVHENWRWRTWYREIKQMLDAGKIGRPKYLSFFGHGHPFQDPNFPINPRYFGRKHLVLFEYGIHHLDVMRYLIGEPISVYAAAIHDHPRLPGEMRIVVTLTWDECIGLLDLGWNSYGAREIVNRSNSNLEDVRIEGEDGAILLFRDPEKGDRMRIVTAAQSEEKPAYSVKPKDAYQASYTAVQRNLIADLLGRGQAETPARENLQTLKLTHAAYRSAEINKVIDPRTMEAIP